MTRVDISKLRKFVAPEIIFGEGAMSLLGQYALKFGVLKPLIVTDPGVIEAGWCDKAIENLIDNDIEYIVYSNVNANPRESEVMEGLDVYQSNNCDAIIAIGGGSPIDCAKGIGIVVTNNENILKFEGADQIEIPIPPLICIPTTGGTSADVSQFCIINDTIRKTKIAIISKAIVPDLALIDPMTLTTMDSYLTACTGLDALVHAIEAFVSNASAPFTDVHALEAIRLISKYLISSIEEPNNIKFRSKIMMASLEAGLAFSNASLGAVHAMAHSLGGFLDLPHGECNALLLRHVVNFNFNSEPLRFLEISKALGIDSRGMKKNMAKKALLDAIDKLRISAGVKGCLEQKGLSVSDIPNLAQRAILDPCLVTNPREASKRDIETIYEEAR